MVTKLYSNISQKIKATFKSSQKLIDFSTVISRQLQKMLTSYKQMLVSSNRMSSFSIFENWKDSIIQIQERNSFYELPDFELTSYGTWEKVTWLYVLIISRMRFRVNPHYSCLNVKELLAPVWLNGWVFVYELSGCRFEFSCSHLESDLYGIFCLNSCYLQWCYK